ncbi:MAG: putative sugar O-methyltransferase [Acidobacteriota bacterium]
MDEVDEKVIGDIQRIIADHHRAVNDDRSLQFWKSLGEKHASLIKEAGFRNFKRTINFEYSQWGVTALRDPKTVNLLKKHLAERRWPTGMMRARFDGDDLDDIRWPDDIDARTGTSTRAATIGGRSRIRGYTAYCGLLWQYASSHDALGCLSKVEEPALGNPLPVRYAGRLISQDLALSSLELNYIAANVPMRRIRRVLEIGAGYGRLAFLFSSMFPDIEYSILDIPPALAISQHYLTSIFGAAATSDGLDDDGGSAARRRIRFMLPHRLAEIPDGHFDLVINISAFDEMSMTDVDGYLQALDRVGSGWGYFQGHATSRKPGLRYGVDGFPYGKDWRQIDSRPHAVVPWFVEKIFQLKAGRRD